MTLIIHFQVLRNLVFRPSTAKKYLSIFKCLFPLFFSLTWWIKEGLCWFMIQVLQTEKRFHGPLEIHPAPKLWFRKESIAIIFPLLSLGLHFLRLYRRLFKRMLESILQSIFSIQYCFDRSWILFYYDLNGKTAQCSCATSLIFCKAGK